MAPERWRHIEELYHAALDRVPDERAAFLAEACADDSGLRREVEELLRYDGAAESFIEEHALAFEARRLEPEEPGQTAPQLIPRTTHRGVQNPGAARARRDGRSLSRA